MSGITGVVLNWTRPDNVVQIVNGWRDSGIIEGIVWNNNSAAPLVLDGWAQVINASEDFGLYTRFAAASMARNECVLIQDDDICLPPKSIASLYAAWQSDPDILHGIFGRMPDAFGRYLIEDRIEASVPIVLTRALLAHRRYALQFFEFAPAFEELQRRGRPYGQGEDIIFSYAVMRRSGRLNRVHRLPVVELPSPNAINLRNRREHLAHRTLIMRACIAEILKEAAGTQPDLAAALKQREPAIDTLRRAARRVVAAIRRRASKILRQWVGISGADAQS